MKRLLLVLMGLALVLLSSTEGWSLPPCPGSPLTGSISDVRSWNDCEGIYIFDSPPKAIGTKYVGEWRNGKPNGQGTMTYANEDKYVGEFKDAKLHGQGTFTFADGNKYVGEFNDGKYQGQGTFTHANGNKYVGEFNDGKYQGQGTFTFTDGRVKEGIWKNDKFLSAKKSTPRVIANQPCPGTYRPTWDNCTGTSTFSDKSKYTGQWKSGKQHGQGTLTYADGEKYVGGFRDGLHHGNGTITHVNGKTLKGIWENDKFKSARD
jgi:hypothetical protein